MSSSSNLGMLSGLLGLAVLGLIAWNGLAVVSSNKPGSPAFSLNDSEMRCAVNTRSSEVGTLLSSGNGPPPSSRASAYI